MADKGSGVTVTDELKKRKQHWTKEGLDRRKAFLIKQDCDAEAIANLKGDELVNLCLVAEGLVAGTLPRKVVRTTMLDPSTTLMMHMLDQMRLDGERRDREFRGDTERRDREFRAAKDLRRAELKAADDLR